MPEITVPGGLKPLPNGRFLRRATRRGERAFIEIGRELGMALPAQRALAPVHRVVAGLPVGRGRTQSTRQFRQHGAVDGCTALGHEGQLDQRARLFDRRVRAGVDFADRFGATAIGRETHHAAGQRGWRPDFFGRIGHWRAPSVFRLQQACGNSHAERCRGQAFRKAQAAARNWINYLTSLPRSHYPATLRSISGTTPWARYFPE